MRFLRSGFLVAMALGTSGCKKPNTASDVKWGALRDQHSDDENAVELGSLLGIPPGGSIILTEGMNGGLGVTAFGSAAEEIPDASFDFSPPSASAKEKIHSMIKDSLKTWFSLLERPVVFHDSIAGKIDGNAINVFSLWNNSKEAVDFFIPKWKKDHDSYLLRLSTLPRILCSFWDGSLPYLAFFATIRPAHSGVIGFCPRSFNLPTEPENLSSFPTLGGKIKLPDEVRAEASLGMNTDPFLHRSQPELERAIAAERGRHPGMRTVNDATWKDTLTHELGHGIGLCDQYSIDGTKKLPVAHNVNCAKAYRSIRPGYAIMNGSTSISVKVPTADDALGVHVLACLAEPAANKIWLAKKPAWFNNIVRAEVARVAKDGDKEDFLPECL